MDSDLLEMIAEFLNNGVPINLEAFGLDVEVIPVR